MSLLNHDCDPNCVIVFEGRHLLLHAVKAIQPEEELTVSYIDVLVPTLERQTQLKKQYCFLCECQRCKSRDKVSTRQLPLCGSFLFNTHSDNTAALQITRILLILPVQHTL
ncbi:Histone-lysine N-methyltransferase SMYD3 [Acipenser ruthenus]|uniref:Histone-lysine N-methyltransferase SMYD3 n=1 Tax=Acipenser ruthenus TaxID=7906 RepID=A0A444UNB3_ACIRT|nr:Histone-lysine N-methyltransferase SMYD3 [Acipenser ruthenus]